jgi:putative ABC transport system substrate-binding protein
MASHIERRKFLATLGGAAAIWPLTARAQQPTMPVIGFLSSASPDLYADRVRAFRQGLSETGYVEGRNVTIEYHWAKGRNDRLPALAADLDRRQVTVIAADSGPAAVAAKAATETIPIVFSTGADPVKIGLVAGLNRPGGKVTGVSFMNVELAAKRVGLLSELLPAATRFGVLVNPGSPLTGPLITELRAAAAIIGKQFEIVTAATNREIDAAFATLMQSHAEALLVAPDAFFANRRVQLALLAVRYRIPAIYVAREFAEAGGLMSYGPELAEMYRQAGIYIGRVLKGEKPGELPVLQPSKFELIINLQTASTLGLDVPATLLARADEVLE